MAATFGADSNFVERFHDLHQKLTKRRLLRKPNYKEAAQQYRELFEEIKAHEKTNQGGGRTGMRLRYYSALCQIGIAKCEQVLKNSCGEAASNLTAGRIYLDIHTDMDAVYKAPHYMECYLLATQCYQLAIDIFLSEHKLHLAAGLYMELASVLQALGNTQEAMIFFKSAGHLYQTSSPMAAIDAFDSGVGCAITHGDLKSAVDILQSIIDLCFVAVCPNRVLEPPSAPISGSYYTNTFIAARVTLVLLKILQRDMHAPELGGLSTIFTQLAESKIVRYSTSMEGDVADTVMLLQDFAKACTLRNANVVRILLPELRQSLTPLQWHICEKILSDLQTDNL